jgi:hypothetical protein
MKASASRTSWDDWPESVEIIVFVGVTSGGRFRYWIVPLSELRKRAYSATLRLSATPTRQPSKFDFVREYEDAWHVLG